MNTSLIPAQEDDDSATGSVDSPGKHLCAAREAQGLTQDHIAGELHLAPATIDALERDDYESLPAGVFTTGYIRKYAHLVGLVPEPLVAAYRPPRRTGDVPPATRKRKCGGNHLILGLVGLGILLALGAALFLWQQSRQPAPGTTPELRAPLSSVAPQPTRADAETPPPRRQRPTAGENTNTDGSVTPVSAAVTAAGTGGEEITAVTDKTVVVSFNGLCWVDIRDSEQKFKLSGPMRKGDREVLGGKPPYLLKLGNATVVRITVGGTPFDLRPVSRGNVARFTLDPDALL